MNIRGNSAQPAPLAKVIGQFRSAFVVIGLLSAVLNFLLIGGSIYLMLVYDSVLPSRSLPTLAGLFAMVTAVYVFQGVFEQQRQHILSDIGASLDRQLAARVQDVTGTMALRGQKAAGDGLTTMRDLDAVRGWLSSAGPAALIDLPWILFFLVAVCFLHWILALHRQLYDWNWSTVEAEGGDVGLALDLANMMRRVGLSVEEARGEAICSIRRSRRSCRR